MKKFLTTILLSITFLVGCNKNPAPATETEQATPKTYTYNGASFSMKFPFDYKIVSESNDGTNDSKETASVTIEPKENVFPIISINSLPTSSFPEISKDLAKNGENIKKSGDSLTVLTEKTIYTQNLKINDHKAAKIIRQLPGSNKLKNTNSSVVEVEDGYTNFYTYFIINDDRLFLIETSADNFSNPKKVEKDFDKIVKKINFKERN